MSLENYPSFLSIGEISHNKPAMNHGDNSDHWAWQHGSIVKIGPEKMKSHIQCLIWVPISSVQEPKYLPVLVSILEVRKGRVFWTTNSPPSICHIFHRDPTTHRNIWHSALEANQGPKIPLDFWTATITSKIDSLVLLIYTVTLCDPLRSFGWIWSNLSNHLFSSQGRSWIKLRKNIQNDNSILK